MKLRNMIQVSALFPVLLAVAIVLGFFVRGILGSLYDEQVSVAARLQHNWNSVMDSVHSAQTDELSSALSAVRNDLLDLRVISSRVGAAIADVQRHIASFNQALVRDSDARGRSLWSHGRDVQDRIAALNREVITSAGEQSANLDMFFAVYIGVLGLCLTGVALMVGRELWQRFGMLPQRVGVLADAMQRFSASGNAVSVPEDGNDELARLSKVFNKTTGELLKARRALEKEVREQKKTAEAARMGSVTLSEALTKVGRARDRVVQEERIHALSQMADGLGHGLNTALTPLVMLSEFLVSNPDEMKKTEQLAEKLKMMNSAAQAAAQQVEYLTHFFRPVERSGPEAVNINETVHEAIDMTEPRWKAMAEAAGARISWDAEFGTVPPVATQKQDLIEAVAAMIINAVEALPKGGAIHIQTCRQGEMGVVVVSDTGCGMDEKLLARCQEPFYTTKTRAGAGMGLTIASTIARHYGGKIVVTSEINKGTQVTFGLPLFSADKSGATASDDVPDDVAPAKILVVDDDPWSRGAVQAILEGAGHQVAAVSGGLAAIEALGQAKYDLIVLDRAMPDLSGDEVAARIGAGGNPPLILMLTGLAEFMEGEKPQYVDFVLSKPANVEELLRAVRRLLAKKK